MFILLFVLSLMSYAGERFERWCFASPQAAHNAITVINPVIVQGKDQISRDQSCVNITADETRMDLITRWIQHRLPSAKPDFSSLGEAKECDILVMKTKQLTKNMNDVKVTRNPYFSETIITGKGEEMATIKVSSGQSATLTVDTQKIEVTCTVLGNEMYRLKFALQFVPTPIIPPVPAGTTVILTNPTPPPDQQGLSVSTIVEAARGETIDMGSITKKLNDDARDLSIEKGGQWTATTGQEQTFVRLKIR